jgi:hypothetical protein
MRSVKMSEPEKIPEGFIPWHGGECPVDRNTRVQVITMGRTKSKSEACDFIWSGAHRVIAYRVIREPITADTVLTEEMECAVDDGYRTFVEVGIHALGLKIKDCDWAKTYRYKDDPKSKFTYEPKQEEVCDMCRAHYGMPTSWHCEGVRCEEALEMYLEDNSNVTDDMKLKIEVGNSYETRCGDKAECVWSNEKYAVFIKSGKAPYPVWMINGREHLSCQTNHDIMSVWTDTPATPEPAPWQVWRDTDGDEGLIIDVDGHTLMMMWSSRQHICTEGIEWVKHLTYLGQLDPAEAMEAMVGTLKEGGE